MGVLRPWSGSEAKEDVRETSEKERGAAEWVVDCRTVGIAVVEAEVAVAKML